MRLFRSSFWTLVSNLGVGLVGMLLAVLHARVLGPEGKGIVTVLVLIPSLAAMLLDAGNSIAVVFFARRDRVAKGLLYWNSAMWSALVGICGAAGVYHFMRRFSDLTGVSDDLLLLWSSALTPLLLFLCLQRWLLLAAGKVAYFNESNLSQPLVILLITYILFEASAATPARAVASYVLGVVAVCVHATVRLEVPRPDWDVRLLLRGVRFGALGHLGTIAQQCNFRFDVLVLGVIAGSTEVGVYSVSYTCAEILLRIPRAIGTILFPKISSTDTQDANALTTLVFRLTNLILVFAMGVVGVSGLILIPKVFGRSFSSSIWPFLILLPGVLFFGWNNILIEDLKGRGYPNFKLYTAGTAFVFTVGLDLLLIPVYGSIGAATASSIAYAVSGILALVLYSGKTGVPIGTLLCVRRADVRILTKQLAEAAAFRTRFQSK